MTLVELETRNCESCGRTYKVLVSSLQKYCSSICNKEVGLKWGGQKTKPKNEERKIESVNVESTGPKKPKDPVAHLLAKHSYFPSERKRAPPIADDMLRTERKRTQDEPSTQEKTERPTMQKQDDSIKAIQTALQNNVHEGIIESPVESYDLPLETMRTEFLESMNTLNASTKQLQSLNESLMKETEFKKPGFAEMQVVRDNAETIARLIQVKVNFVKTLRK